MHVEFNFLLLLLLDYFLLGAILFRLGSLLFVSYFLPVLLFGWVFHRAAFAILVNLLLRLWPDDNFACPVIKLVPQKIFQEIDNRIARCEECFLFVLSFSCPF